VPVRYQAFGVVLLASFDPIPNLPPPTTTTHSLKEPLELLLVRKLHVHGVAAVLILREDINGRRSAEVEEECAGAAR
jgi:hypothetical protein